MIKYKNIKNKSVYVSQGITIVGSIIVGKLIAIFINPQDYGKYILQFAFVSFLFSLLLQPGIIYYRTSLIEQYKNSKSIFFNISSIAGGHAIALVITLVYSLIYSDFSLFIISLFYFPSFYIFNAIKDLYTTSGKFKIANFLQNVFSLTNFGITLICLFCFPNIKNLLWLIILVSNIIPILAFYSVYKKDQNEIIKKLKFSLLNISSTEEKKNLITFVFPLISLAIFSWFISNIDKYLIAFFLGVVNAGKYSICYNLAAKTALIFGPISITVIPSIYKKLNQQNYSEVFSNLNKGVRKYLIIGIIVMLGTGFFFRSIGNLFLSKQYEDAFFIIPFISLSYIIMALIQLKEHILYANEATLLVLLHNVVGAVLNVLLNILLLNKIGLIGAAVSMVLSSLAQLLFLEFLLKRKVKLLLLDS